MRFQIEPVKSNSITERWIFKKKDKEIKCGYVYDSGYLTLKVEPTFLKTYNPEIGICLDDIKGCIERNFNNRKKVIHFSETIPEEERKKFLKKFEKEDINYFYSNKFLGYGGKFDSSEMFIFGELICKKTFEFIEDEFLVNLVFKNINLSRDEIIRNCGYVNEDNELHYILFYEKFCEAIKWRSLDWDTQFFYDFIDENRSVSTPTDFFGTIGGRDILTVTEIVGDINEIWTDEKFIKVVEDPKDYSWSGPYETGNPNNGSKGYFYGHNSLEQAFMSFSGFIPDLMRPAYLELSSEHEGMDLKDYLEEYGEHPIKLIEIMFNYNSFVHNPY